MNGRHHFQPPPPPMPAPMAPRTAGRTARWLMLGIFAGALVAFPAGCTIGVAVGAAGDRSGAPVVSASGPASNASPTRKPSPSPSPTRREPGKSDFKVTLKELSRDCYGSAGCNVTYRPRLSTENAGLLDPDTTYEITYRIKGGDSPETGTILLTDGEYERSEGMISTPAGAKLSAVVTDVEAL